MASMQNQPQGLLCVSTSPLCNALKLAIMPGVNRSYDAATGRTNTPTGVKQVPFSSGITGGFGVTKGFGSTDKIVTGLSGAFPLTGRSYFFRVLRNGPGGGNLGRVFDKTNGSAGQMIYWSNGTGALVYSIYVGGAEQIFTIGSTGNTTAAAVGTEFDVLVTHRQVGTTAELRAYVNGVLVRALDITGTLTDSTTAAITLGNRTPDNARNWDGTIECAYVWDRILSQKEAEELSQNRYQVFGTTGTGFFDRVLYAKATSSGAGPIVISASGSAVGISTLTSAAQAIYRVYGTVQSGASVSAPIVSLFYSQGTSTTASTSGSSSVSIIMANGAGTSTSSVSGNSYAIWNVLGASSGDALVEGAAAALVPVQGTASTGNSEGTSTTSAECVSFFDAVAEATGQASVVSEGVTIACASGGSTGFAGVESLSVTIYNASAISLSAATVEAIASALVEAVGQSGGVATLSGKTEGGVFYTAVGDKFSMSVTFSPYTITVEDKPYKITFKS